MRTIGRTSLVLPAIAAASVLALAGCSAGSPDADGPVTLTMWVNSADQPAQKSLYAAWEEETGNSIEFVSIAAAGFEEATMTRWATGSRPDLMEWHPERAFLAGLNPPENLQPLDDMAFIAESDGLYDDNGRWGDSVYAAILDGPSLYGMYFMAGGTLWPLTVLPFNLWGGHYETGNAIAYNEASFTDPDGPFLSALERFTELQDAGCYNSDINTATEEQSLDAIYTGKAGILFQTSAELPLLEAAAGGDGEALSAAVGWGSVGDEESWANYQPVPTGTYLAPKTGDGAREAAARDFIEFATGEYYQTYIDEAKVAPTISGVVAPTDITALQQEINDFYASAPKEPLFNANIAGFAEFVQLMPQLAAGQITPMELAEKEQAVVEQASRAAGVEGW